MGFEGGAAGGALAARLDGGHFNLPGRLGKLSLLIA